MKLVLIVVMAVSVAFAVTGTVKAVAPAPVKATTSAPVKAVATPVKVHVPTLHIVTERIIKADTTFKFDTVKVITYDTIVVKNTLKDTSIIVKTEVDTIKAKAKK